MKLRLSERQSIFDKRKKMPLYSDLAILVIPKSILEEKYTGGLEKFREVYRIADENNHHQEDSELVGLVAMNPDEFDIDRLVAAGLHFDEKSKTSRDFTVYVRYGDALWEIPTIENNALYIWHTDCDPELKAIAIKRGNMYMDEIARLIDNGVDVFNTLK